MSGRSERALRCGVLEGEFFLIGDGFSLGDFFFLLFCLLSLNLSIQEQLCETNTNLLYFLKLF